MYAIIETDGKQHKVAVGDVIRCDQIHLAAGEKVTFERVFFADNNGTALIGDPIVAGASVTGTIRRQAKDKKILVFKYKPKKRVRKTTGHRQRFAEVEINAISLP